MVLLRRSVAQSLCRPRVKAEVPTWRSSRQ